MNNPNKITAEYLGKYNFLMITLDSCRYDTAAAAYTPNMDKYGGVHLSYSPGYFTLPSHMCFFKGIFPSTWTDDGVYNKEVRRIFKLFPRDVMHDNASIVFAAEKHPDIIHGFNSAGYETIGIAGVSWFDPAKATSACLINNFKQFHYGVNTREENPQSIENSIIVLKTMISSTLEDRDKFFVFMNIALTHSPYSWGSIVKGITYSKLAQVACVEHFDELLPSILAEVPKPLYVMIMGDHGDLFGEDGQWGHPSSHPELHKVPVLYFEVQE